MIVVDFSDEWSTYESSNNLFWKFLVSSKPRNIPSKNFSPFKFFRRFLQENILVEFERMGGEGGIGEEKIEKIAQVLQNSGVIR